jgi:hypothetical protein
MAEDYFSKVFSLNVSDNIELRSAEIQFRHNECMCLHYALFQYYLFLATMLDVLACCWHLHKLHMVVCIQNKVWDTANHTICIFAQWSMYYILHSTWKKTNYEG